MQRHDADTIPIETKFLRCILSEDERRSIADKLSRAVLEKDHKDQELRSVSTQIRAEIKAQEAIISSCAEVLRAGYEFRDIECEISIDHEKGTYQAIRTDTGEIIEERKLTPAEKQMALS